ncbi:hypothetical protein GCM10023224_41420 [Streptomonospora halophila]|uniref:Uncharacterized protein n=1 Tax=Streptomonospora halophila TaxID=427369 RepID=A0ABP9GTA7_9ACTN
MTGWFRYEDEGLRMFFGVGGERWVCRRVDAGGSGVRPVVASVFAFARVLRARDDGGSAAVCRYAGGFGVSARASEARREQPRSAMAGSAKFALPRARARRMPGAEV